MLLRTILNKARRREPVRNRTQILGEIPLRLVDVSLHLRHTPADNNFYLRTKPLIPFTHRHTKDEVLELLRSLREDARVLTYAIHDIFRDEHREHHYFDVFERTRTRQPLLCLANEKINPHYLGIYYCTALQEQRNTVIKFPKATA